MENTHDVTTLEIDPSRAEGGPEGADRGETFRGLLKMSSLFDILVMSEFFKIVKCTKFVRN